MATARRKAIPVAELVLMTDSASFSNHEWRVPYFAATTPPTVDDPVPLHPAAP
jgi:hypothetical protein